MKRLERKKAEWVLVRQWENSDNSYHLIDLKWIQDYLFWIANLDCYDDFTVSVSNENLLEKGILKLGLKNEKDYEKVSTKVYLLMKELYGGGPDIPLWRLDNASLSSQIQTQQKDLDSDDLTQNSMLLTNPEMTETQLNLPVKGLANSYFYCYLNATIQCLLSVPEFNAYFYEKIYNQKGNNDDEKSDVYFPPKKAKKFVFIFSDLIKLYNEGKYDYVDLYHLNQAVSTQFASREQHDAQEFLRYILSQIQDEINPRIELRSSCQFKNAEEAYYYYRKTQISIVDQLFAGQLVNIIICQNCKDDGPSFDPFFDLSLGVIEGSNYQTILESLDRFFQDENISNDYYCDKCKNFSRARKQSYISKTPKYLTIHIKRFKSYTLRLKLLEFVNFPLKNLSLKKYLIGKNCGAAQYNLIAMIVHSGTPDSGHYYAYVRRDSKWFYCNDSISYEVQENRVMLQEAYMLFYQRIDENQQKLTSSDLENKNLSKSQHKNSSFIRNGEQCWK